LFKRVRGFGCVREGMKAIGWTKMQVISNGLTNKNMEERLGWAEKYSARQLQERLGNKPPSKTHCVLLYFTDRQYARFKKALVKHGASPARRGLKNQEAAILDLIASD
jgi:hypothetical protein